MYASHQDFIQIGIIIVVLVNLIFQIKRENRNCRYYRK